MSFSKNNHDLLFVVTITITNINEYDAMECLTIEPLICTTIAKGFF